MKLDIGSHTAHRLGLVVAAHRPDEAEPVVDVPAGRRKPPLRHRQIRFVQICVPAGQFNFWSLCRSRRSEPCDQNDGGRHSREHTRGLFHHDPSSENMDDPGDGPGSYRKLRPTPFYGIHGCLSSGNGAVVMLR